jgi:hypothetical protein
MHVVEAGLSPLLYHATRECQDMVPPAWRNALRSADLTAQLRFENLKQTAVEIIDACQNVGVRPTLLKGISISHQHYPLPHLRPMGDIDILVRGAEFELVESTLIRSGLVRPPGQEKSVDSHHGIPLYHPHRRVWVEVHSALFPKTSKLNTTSLFSPAQIAAHSINSTFLGRPVYRLTSELQLIYIACSWMQDLACNSLHSSLVLPLLDAIYLLRDSRKVLDWDRLEAMLDAGLGAASLYVMLSYLSGRKLAEPFSVMHSRIASRQTIISVWERKILDLLVDTYLVGGRPFGRLLTDWTALIVLNTLLEPGSRLVKLCALPWNILFPPSLANRYSMAFHGRRVMKILRMGDLERN